MLQKNAIIGGRKRLGIPEEGLPGEKEARAWYREHFKQAKGAEFQGSFGFHYQPFQGMFEFDYQSSLDKFSISAPSALDQEVPLDKEVISLATKLNIPDWASPALRLVLLVGRPPDELELRLPEYLIVPIGGLQVLVHPVVGLSLRPWRKIGEMMGLLPGEGDLRRVPGTITSYGSRRKNKKEELYRQTLFAYMEAIGERRMKKIRGERVQGGKWGLLVETAKILESKYGWEDLPDSYTVRRYLDRAEKIWHISTRWRLIEKKEKGETY
jgi:hypothetical protein